MAFTYPGVGITQNVWPRRLSDQTPSQISGLPMGYVIDHNRVRLGAGLDTYNQAKRAIRQWQMFNLSWVQICWPSNIEGYAPIEVGETVGVLAHSPFWSLNPCRIVYTVDEQCVDEKSIDEKTSYIHRFGFGYGTLPGHLAMGEERFQVEWHEEDDSVWYDIVAFSRPNHILAKLGYPMMRHFQKRFARDSKRAMIDR